MKLQDVIRIRRKELGLSLEQVAQACSVGKSIVAKWERGEVTNIRRDNLAALSDVLQVSPLVLMEREELSSSVVPLSDNISPMPRTIKKPRLGTIACGQPILAEQNVEDHDRVPDWIECDFTLKCRGDSMTGARIFDGDIVCIRSQPEVENGEIAAVLIDDEATLKRVYIQKGRLTLMPENPAYQPLIYVGDELEHVRILGKATYFISAVR